MGVPSQWSVSWTQPLLLMPLWLCFHTPQRLMNYSNYFSFLTPLRTIYHQQLPKETFSVLLCYPTYIISVQRIQQLSGTKAGEKVHFVGKAVSQQEDSSLYSDCCWQLLEQHVNTGLICSYREHSWPKCGIFMHKAVVSKKINWAKRPQTNPRMTHQNRLVSFFQWTIRPKSFIWGFLCADAFVVHLTVYVGVVQTYISNDACYSHKGKLCQTIFAVKEDNNPSFQELRN